MSLCFSGCSKWIAVAGAVALAFVAGCSGAAGPPAKAASGEQAQAVATAQAPAEDPSALPEALEALQPSEHQRAQLLALRDDLTERVEPAADAGREFALAVAQAARRCDPRILALETAASWAVVQGEQARGAVLDGIDRLHHILTPEQRQALVDRLLGDEQQSRSQKPTEAGAKSLGDELGLSLGQMLKLVERALALRSDIEDRIEPWREKLRAALVAFPKDDFSARSFAASEMPVVALVTRFVRDGLRSMLPILDSEQCKALGEFIQKAVEENAPETPSSGSR